MSRLLGRLQRAQRAQALNEGPRVVDVTRGRICVERGKRSTVDAAERVAIVAQYSATPDQPLSLSRYLAALDASDYATIVVSTCESPEPLEFPHGIPERTIIIRRPNLGYDFGSWTTGLGWIPGVRSKPVVLLTNDSMLGPFAPIDGLLEWAAEPPGPDIRCLTTSHQFGRHMQSYFLSFRGGILAERAWVRFFDGIRVQPTKEDVVMAYELGLSRLAFSEAYSIDEWVAGPDIGAGYENPTIRAWQGIITSGAPFLKRTILTHPDLTAEAAASAEYLQRMYNIDIHQW
ncbi:rhamnan synthesis F family protein [Actinomyces sp. zg296]|uniref:rhamnan synthesis F family protein n=1 Tax=Actinomyces sp. zg296 TaxID=2609289 RepID=UPI001357EC43|nr:rhamnan synthesis F family protein [Actinomyces sp. zg296]